MADHGKRKVPETREAPRPEPEKPSRPKPEKTLSLDEAIEKLEAIEFRGLTEEDRLGAVLEIRARLKEQESHKEEPAKALARRILLLRLWHELVQLRIVDVQLNRKPPFERVATERLFPPVEGVVDVSSPSINERDGTTLQEALKPLDPKPFVPPAVEDEGLVSVKLLETEMVRGMKLPAGIIVDVQLEDADHLVEKGKAVRV